MQTTMNLIEQALTLKPAQHWHEQLGLNRNALHNARMRGHLSPAIAGALAEAMGLDPQPWIVIAALEGEKESACKSRMVRKFLQGSALAGLTAVAAVPASAATLLGAVGQAVCALCKIAKGNRQPEAQGFSSRFRQSNHALTC